jgi:hypothetical protein
VLTWAAFALVHAGREFIVNNFLLNARWQNIPTGRFLELMETSAPVVALSLLGMFFTVRTHLEIRRERLEPPEGHAGEVLLACTLGGLLAGVAVIPVAHRQYYLMPLPILSLFAAKGLLGLVDRARRSARDRMLVLSLVPLSVLPVLALCDEFAVSSRNDAQLARLRHVFESTTRTDVVMDGWEGTGVFRPHAFYYFFIHDESLPLAREHADAYVDELEGGKVRPRLIALDKHLVALGPKFMAFVKGSYVSNDDFLYFLKN